MTHVDLLDASGREPRLESGAGARQVLGDDRGARRFAPLHRGVDMVHALEHVSLNIPAGRFIALMGPSGSGKSTLLNLLVGLDRPDGGEVVVAGQPLSGLDEDALAVWRARHVALVFQFYNLIPVLSAIEDETSTIITSCSAPAAETTPATTASRCARGTTFEGSTPGVFVPEETPPTPSPGSSACGPVTGLSSDCRATDTRVNAQP
jgi:hypothetical protein